jgi:hypothetical protein
MTNAQFDQITDLLKRIEEHLAKTASTIPAATKVTRPLTYERRAEPKS